LSYESAHHLLHDHGWQSGERAMVSQNGQPIPPGSSVLGGAAGGLSYEGALRDAMALEDRDRRRDAGRHRGMPQRQVQAAPAAAPSAEQERLAGG
jgi:hypothetical protein